MEVGQLLQLLDDHPIKDPALRVQAQRVYKMVQPEVMNRKVESNDPAVESP